MRRQWRRRDRCFIRAGRQLCLWQHIARTRLRMHEHRKWQYRYGQHLFQLRHHLPFRHGRALPPLRLHHDGNQLIQNKARSLWLREQ